ncbi:MAG TPA: hypothetical protein VF635_11165, partial [Propionibacteriaceae bacterium]
VPTLRDYFGLTRPAGIVYDTSLPLLLLWFLTLAAAYRFRVMDRLLGLNELTEDSPVEPGPSPSRIPRERAEQETAAPAGSRRLPSSSSTPHT